MKILIIEDQADLIDSIKESLEEEQYVVETAASYLEATDKLHLYEYDCILLDIMLPDGSGMDILKELKAVSKTENVIIISAKDSLDDKLEGLELGADDYLTKPFHIAELRARIKAVLRRKNQDGNNSIELENIALNTENHELFVSGELVQLNRKEFNILYYFLLNKNRLITHTALAEHVWGDNADQSDNFDFIYYQIKNLRKKLQQADAQIHIKAVYGIGYKLLANS